MVIEFKMTGDVNNTVSSNQRKGSVNKIIQNNKNSVPLSVIKESKGTSFLAGVVNFLKDIFKVSIEVVGSSHRQSFRDCTVKEAHVEQEQWLKKQVQSAINLNNDVANLPQNNRLKDLTKEDKQLVEEAGQNLRGIVERCNHSSKIELPARAFDSEELNNLRKK